MRRATGWVLLAGLLGADVAQAYAPPAAYIMNLAAGKRQKLKLDAIRVTLKRTEYKDGQPVGDPVEVTVTYRHGGRVRREWTDKDGKHARLSDATRAVWWDGDKRSKGTVEPSLLDALWGTGDEAGERPAAQDRAMAVLTAAGVAEVPVGFARTDGRVAWVVGSAGKSVDVSQAWVDKDDFLPLRLVRAEKGKDKDHKGPVWDERYRGWGAQGGDMHPARVELYKDGVLVRLDELVRVDPSPKLDERDFKFD